MADIVNFLFTPFMACEILAAEYMFALKQERKDYFYVRFLGAVFVCVSATVWIQIIYTLATGKMFLYTSVTDFTDSLFKVVYYLLIFLMTIACVAVSYEAEPWTVFLCCAGGYVTQHMANNVVSLLMSFRPLQEIGHTFLWQYLFRLAVYIIVYGIVYLVFVRSQDLEYGSKKNIRRKVWISLVVVFICIGLSRITTDDMRRNSLAVVAETVYAIVSCMLVLNMMYDISENDRMKYEVDMMGELLHRDREQYRLAKENIEIINRKCHDLKHQIHSLQHDLSKEHIREVEEAIMIYNSVVNVKTGNDVLDVILTEKSLLCEEKHITLTCMVHAENLAFMDKMDVYSLFGNALSNAIECVSAIEEESKRCISVNVQTVSQILSIHVENFCQEEPVFEDGFPVTKKNKEYHGFGMRSMDYIARKYDGVMSAFVSGGRFYLDFAIPVPTKEKQDVV